MIQDNYRIDRGFVISTQPDTTMSELSQLVTEGILLPKQSSDWAAPIVPVEKADGSMNLKASIYRMNKPKVTRLISYSAAVKDIFPLN